MYAEPKKSLGQNFLVDKNIQRKIISYCELKPQDIVLEIGAGKGALTALIAQKGCKVYALEIDNRLCNILRNTFRKFKNVKVIHQDILKFNFRKYFANIEKIKVIGNIPYYITSPIIEQLLRYHDKIETIFITVQKEFARRLTADIGSKDYGALSCFVQYYARPKSLFVIKKTSFKPSPKVDSCLVRLEIRDQPAVKIRDEKLFFKIIRASFNKRRKTLRNSLRDVICGEKLNRFFDKYNIDRNIRPEDLGLQDFAHLTNA